jgi:hypothetical protein
MIRDPQGNYLTVEFIAENGGGAGARLREAKGKPK